MMHLSLMKGIAPAYFDAALGVADEGVGSATRSAKRFKRPGHPPSPHVRPSRMLSPPSAKAIKASRNGALDGMQTTHIIVLPQLA